MTVPNLITTIRIILTPIFVIYLLDGQLVSALVVFVLCGISDGLDGLLARVLNQKSQVGVHLDPIADKILLVAAFLTLSIQGSFPAWLSVTVISRDVIIGVGVVVLVLTHQEFKKKPTIPSKITTTLQIITVIAALSKGLFTFPDFFYTWLYYLCAIATISSGLHYIYIWYRMMGEGNLGGRES
jgi:cardiolipin synthase